MVRATRHGKEEVILKPGAALSIVELGKLRVPASDLEPYDASLDAVAVKPTVPVTAVHSWLSQNENIAVGAIEELALVHAPIYQFKYRYKDQSLSLIHI